MQDRLVNNEDRQWFQDVLREKIKTAFEVKFEDVLSNDILIYGDFMVPNADIKVYAEVTDYEKVISIIDFIWYAKIKYCRIILFCRQVLGPEII